MPCQSVEVEALAGGFDLMMSLMLIGSTVNFGVRRHDAAFQRCNALRRSKRRHVCALQRFRGRRGKVYLKWKVVVAHPTGE